MRLKYKRSLIINKVHTNFPPSPHSWTWTFLWKYWKKILNSIKQWIFSVVLRYIQILQISVASLKPWGNTWDSALKQIFFYSNNHQCIAAECYFYHKIMYIWPNYPNRVCTGVCRDRKISLYESQKGPRAISHMVWHKRSLQNCDTNECLHSPSCRNWKNIGTFSKLNLAWPTCPTKSRNRANCRYNRKTIEVNTLQMNIGR